MKSVNRGIALLDAKVPGWFDKVDPEKINLHSNTNCILGQIFGHYQNGIEILPVGGFLPGKNRTQLEHHGFNPHSGLHHVLSKRAWRKAIKARVNSAEAQQKAEALKAQQAADLGKNLEAFIASVKEDPFWDFDYVSEIPAQERVDA